MQALGLIETRGLIAAIESADTMLKAADVTLIDKTYVGGGLVSIAVIGGVGAVKAAVEAGAAAVIQINGSLLVSQHVIPRPHDEIDELLTTEKSVKSEKIGVAMPKEAEPAPSTDAVSELPIGTEASEPTGIESIEKAADEKIKDLVNSNTVVEEAVTEELVPIAEVLVEKNLITESPMTEEIVAEAPVAVVSKTEVPVPETSTVIPLAVYPEIKKSVLPDIKLEDINKATIDRIVLEHGASKAIEFLSTLRVTKLRSLAREYENMGIAGREISRSDGKTLIFEFEKYYD